MTDLRSINSLTLEQAALAYVSMGWPVLPLMPRNKKPLGALVQNGLKMATTDLDTVREWWEKYPGANIGLLTGVVFDVLDLDGERGMASMAALAPGYKHAGPVASTGKGYHLLFAPTGARNAANKLPGIDFRGQNGYIVGAPSYHPSGSRYRWVRSNEIPAPVEWLDYIVTPKRNHISTGIDPASMEPILNIWTSVFTNNLQPLGTRWITNCIWHDDSTPSLVLYPENNSFFCFGCNEWGDSIDLASLLSSHLGQKPSDLRTSARSA